MDDISKTNEISKYIPKNINKITITNNLSDESNPTTINVENIEKIEEFMNLIFMGSSATRHFINIFHNSTII